MLEADPGPHPDALNLKVWRRMVSALHFEPSSPDTSAALAEACKSPHETQVPAQFLNCDS